MADISALDDISMKSGIAAFAVFALAICIRLRISVVPNLPELGRRVPQVTSNSLLIA